MCTGGRNGLACLISYTETPLFNPGKCQLGNLLIGLLQLYSFVTTNFNIAISFVVNIILGIHNVAFPTKPFHEVKIILCAQILCLV